jgi:thioredoxin-related protein
MRKILLLAAASIGLFAFAINELPIGSPMPKGDVKMKDVTGKEITLNEARKINGLLVMFSCNTCPYVIKNQQRTRDISAYALDKNIGVILINSNETQRDNEDSFESMKQYAKQQGYQWYYTVDKNSELADAFGATKTPECFLFNKEEKLVYHGAIDDNPGNESAVNRQHLKEAINEMSADKEVLVTTSRSVGCSIKRKTK